MDLSIIIVSWNVCDKLKNNLRSLLASAGNFSYEIFVVDNASTDGTVSMLERDFPQVKLIVNRQNLGFAKANNIALKQAKGKWLLLLNPDMRVKPETLVNFLAWLKTSTAAIAGCRLVDERGRLVRHVRRFPGLKDQAAIALKLPHLKPAILDNYLSSDFDYSQPAEVDSIRGSFFAIKRSTYRLLGGLDERYFIWFEEVDYCRQAAEAGLEVWYTPAAVAIDYVGQGFKLVGRSTKQKYFRDSMLKYFAKWQGPVAVLILRLAWWPSGVITWLAETFKLKAKAKT
jgi:GT2 family glycosyltransferase